jgi:environmental stress-induced protein Ves
MMTLIKPSAYKIMPWKNGLGITSEIEIYPKSASFSNSDFLWRLSSAQICSTNEFSYFEGYDRILMVCVGDGLMLNNIRLNPLVPYKFQGEQLIKCNLTANEVIDLGLIYKREMFTADMTVKIFSSEDNPQTIFFNGGLNFLFCVKGSFIANNQIIEPMDCLKIQGPMKIQYSSVKSIEPAVCVHAILIQKS